MTFFSAAVMIFFILDPLGNIPIFQAVLKDIPEQKKTRVLIRELLFAYIILCTFLFMGGVILSFLGLKESTLSIAGGVILFLIALKMVFPEHGVNKDIVPEEPFIVPLAMPMIAGPSSIAVLLLLASKYPEKIWYWAGSLTCAWLLAAVILLASSYLFKVIGNKGLRAIERLMGMLLIMMAIQMLLDGIKAYWQSGLA